MPEKIEKVRRVKLKYQSEWLKHKDVVGIGIGTVAKNEIGIVISVRENAEVVRKQIPESVEGVPVKVQTTGEFSAK